MMKLIYASSMVIYVLENVRISHVFTSARQMFTDWKEIASASITRAAWNAAPAVLDVPISTSNGVFLGEDMGLAISLDKKSIEQRVKSYWLYALCAVLFAICDFGGNRRE